MDLIEAISYYETDIIMGLWLSIQQPFEAMKRLQL